MDKKFRKERDSMGEKMIPEDLLYGIHTSRSLENFRISSLRPSFYFYKALAALKLACARANITLGLLDKKKGQAIIQAAKEVIDGQHIEFLPLDVFQAGSGTSTNMNINEVLANRALIILGHKPGERDVLHPNDHVNKGQSTNNIYPSAIRLAALYRDKELMKELSDLVRILYEKSKEFQTLLKTGRTHLQDAVPMTLGQEFSAYARALEKSKKRIKEGRDYLLELGVGGNAIGTGMNTPKKFRSEILSALSELTGFKFRIPGDGIEITCFLTDLAAFSSSLKMLSLDLNKIANDLRLLASGPKTGLGEISLPAVEPGSSIMPGKINPSIAEALNMVCAKVIGNDACITQAVSEGQLELNTRMPVVGYSLLESLEILIGGIRVFREKCVKGVKPNKERLKEYFENSAALATALNPVLGYDRVAEIVKESLSTGKSLMTILDAFCHPLPRP